MGTIVVTGAAGFIGSCTCDLLLASGYEVIGVDNLRSGRESNLGVARQSCAFQFIRADVAEPGALDQIAARTRPDALIHLAGLVSVHESIGDPATNFQINVGATQLVAEAARKHRIGRVVFASSAAVYGNVDAGRQMLTENSATNPISPYGAAKLASEAILLGHAAAYGFTVRCQRYFNVYGPRQDPRSPYSGVISILTEKLRARQAPTIFGDGEQSRDFVAVRDVARANLIAATAPRGGSGVANICTGTATTLNQLVASFRAFDAATPGPVHAPARSGDIRHSVGSPARAAKELGFTATVRLEDGLSELFHAPW